MEAEHVIDGRLSRIPYGMRGLKSFGIAGWCDAVASHPIRDAWIEMRKSWPLRSARSRIPYGMRGLKLPRTEWREVTLQVASHTGCVD